tara:strand:+ start:611 stop:1057 length:447 start_codon:yes stop_codon:yes gene_type:complete
MKMKVRSLSPKLPLTYDEQQGYRMNTGFVELVIQNLKMLILTIPGERIMEPDFGVGLKTFLFEQNVERVHGTIAAKIKRQAQRYIPSISITSVDFFTSENTVDMPDNYLHIAVSFYIKPLETSSKLDLLFDSNKGLFIDGNIAGRELR